MKILQIQNRVIFNDKKREVHAVPNVAISPETQLFQHYSSVPLSYTGTYSSIGIDSKKKLTEKDYKKAKEYIDNFDTSNGELIDMKKLNGLQYGIKVFEGLSMVDIVSALDDRVYILTRRSCSSRCSHCGDSALPHYYKKDSNFINSMSWEDFSDLTDGIGELKSRTNLIGSLILRNEYIAPFLDSDGMEIEMLDKKGNTHDFCEVCDKLYKASETKILFDTSGWTQKNLKIQQRAEKIVKYLTNEENADKLYEINISINPFHGLNDRSIQNKYSDNKDKAKKFRALYVDRMANSILTFLPLISKCEKFNLIIRTADNQKSKYVDYNDEQTSLLLSEIEAEVYKKMRIDLNTDKKYSKDEADFINNIETVAYQFDVPYKYIYPEGRAKNVLLSEADGFNESVAGFNKLIDANGQVYLYSKGKSTPTSIQLNFNNKYKQTPLIGEDCS